MSKKAQLSEIIIIVLICILAILALFIITQQVYKKINSLNETNQTDNNTCKENCIFFNNSSDLQLGSLYYQNYTPRIIIYCYPYENINTSNYDEEQIQNIQMIIWIYSQCAMIEANEHVNLYNYDSALKKYHVCFEFSDLNKSVGDC